MKNYIPLKRKKATYITNYENLTRITLYNTEVVSFNDDIIILNSGGWTTVTTKRRINQASEEFSLGIGIQQTKGQWLIMLKNPKYTTEGNEPYWLDERIPFVDGIILHRRHFGSAVVPFLAIEAVTA